MRALLLALIFGSGATASAFDFETLGYKGRLVPGVWESSWTDTLDTALNNNSLLNHNESQIDKMCEGYRDSETKRRTFWRQLFISLAWKESLHGPGNWIKFNGGINDGLYQINPKLRKAYGCGSVDLYNAHENIKCGVKMAKRLVDKFGSFLTGSKGGMAAYWQPLRSTSSYNRKNREFILSNVRQACKTGSIEYHSRDLIAPPGDMLDLADMTVNTTDDLGLDASELESHEEDMEREEENFLFDPSSGTFFDLTR